MSPDFSKGLVPVVVQNAETGKVLMMAYMDEESWTKTRATGRAWFHSRERGLWEKGATSGNTMEVVEVRLDCDLDAVLLVRVPQARVRPERDLLGRDPLGLELRQGRGDELLEHRLDPPRVLGGQVDQPREDQVVKFIVRGLSS